MRRLIPIVIPCVFLSGCFGPGEGVEVPTDEIYFPVGLALDQDASHLFLVNSDFDLQYNGGAVQSYDLNELVAEELPRHCHVDSDCPTTKTVGAGSAAQEVGLRFKADVCDPDLSLCVPALGESPCPRGDRQDADRLLFPGRCNPIPPRAAQIDAVKIGAFATDAVIRQRPASSSGFAERLFVPVRGDSTLHWLDVEDGKLHCGAESTADHACDDAHRAGNNASESKRGLTLNSEPFAIDADARGDTLVVSNQTTGTASLFVNGAWDDSGPRLAFALRSDRIPSRPVGVAAVPQPTAEGEDPNPFHAYMMTFRNSAQVRLLRFAPDGSEADDLANDPRPYLVDAGGVGIDANSVGSDSRGIAIDASAREAAKARCAKGDQACAGAAGLVPLDVYVANRAPSTLLIGRTQPPSEYPYFFQTVALTTGPSRVVIGHVATPSGELETRVFVACFDSRRVFVYDPQRARVETEILTGRGPHAMAVDTERKLLYVGHFTDSYVGVYSLDLAFPATYGTMLGTLGTPKPPRSSK